MKTLKKLYRGKLNPHVNKAISEKQIQIFTEECDKIEKLLKANMSEEDFKLFQEYNNYSEKITDLCMEDKFCEGFKLCADLISDVQ